ncbi:MAG: endonuclease/exonuclease/phosphatase family protein, partial [Candidatus Phaeomarinobacter sp.]
HYDDEFNMHQGALEAVIAPPGRAPVRIIVLHLAYISMEKGDAERLAQLDHVLGILDRRTGEGAAWSGPNGIGEDDWSEGQASPDNPESAVLLGDFNMVPGSAPYVKMITSQAGGLALVDSWKALGNRARDGFTYPLDEERYGRPGIKLDYIFVTENLARDISSAWIDNEADGSDHQPYWIEIGNEN